MADKDREHQVRGGGTSGAPATQNDSTVRFGDDFVQAMAALDPAVPDEEQAAIQALPAGSALLIVRRGPNAGARFLLNADSVISGRHPDADIFLDDVTVSRRHAVFNRTATGYEVRDLGSLNGTYYNGVRTDQADLENGGEVQVGKFKLTFYQARDTSGKADS